MEFFKRKLSIINLNPEKIPNYWGITKKLIIALFFLLNVGIMFIDGFPDRSAMGEKFINLLSQYQAWSMLYQPWAMFAPNPMNTNAYIQAEIQFDDGSTEQWPLLRQRLLTNPRKILVGDRYRILGQETLLPNTNELVWQDISRYVLNQVGEKEVKGKNRTIKQIVFKRFYNRVLIPPEAPFTPHGTLHSNYDHENVYYYLPTHKKVTYEAQNNY